ncbi:MAG: FtsW/RodA/SpoVE family cell cycle protein [Lentisphaeria bacterium]|nr:FtsW/RodA/SpoVE family cell cycle protein [Lentisphaeria bacterium]
MNRSSRIILLIPAVAFLIILWGILTISASQSGGTQPLFLAGKQLCFAVLGGALMLLAAGIPFEQHCRWRYFYAVPALILLLFLPLAGVRVNGMQGWYSLWGCFIQPSELGKGIWLLLIACAGMRWKPVMAWSLAWIVPILLQPDFGTAAVYSATLVFLWYSAGGSWKVLATGIAAAAAGTAVFVCTNAYAMKRLTAFWNPDADPGGGGWHIRQFQMAIAHGRWTGAKLGQTFWSNEYLPLAYNDSAYAAMAETLGFAGCMTAMVMYAVLYILLIRHAMRQDLQDNARRYLAGAAALLAVQTLLHAGVNVGLLPPTGLTMPLISYGGSSLTGTLLMLGIACSAAKSSMK